MKSKSLIKNSLYNVIYRVLSVLYPLVTSTYVAHIILSTGVGKVAYAQNIAQYFILLAPLGLTQYGVKAIAKEKDNKTKECKTFTELFVLNAISTTLCAIVYYILVCNIDFCDEKILYYVAGLPILFNYCNIDWFYQGREEYKYITIRSLLIKLVSVVAIFVFVRDANDYVNYAVIYSLGMVGNYVLNVINLKKMEIRFIFKGLNIKRHLKDVFVLLAAAVAIEIYTLLDTTMLGAYCEDAVIGYYTNSVKLARIVISTITAIGAVLLPRLSYYAANGMKKECSSMVSNVASIMLYLSVPCMAGLFLLSDTIIPLFFGVSFVDAIPTFRIATLLVLVLGYSNLFGTQVLVSFDAENKMLTSTLCGAITNFMLNMLLIPRYFQNGAIMASVVSEILVTILTFYFASKYVQVVIPRRRILGVVLGTLVMIIVVIANRIIFDNLILEMLVAIALGGVSYILVSLSVDKELKNMIKGLMKK